MGDSVEQILERLALLGIPLLSPSVSSPAHVASANSTRISNGASRTLLVVADKSS